MFINEVKTLAGFATELSTLNELLADPKNLKKLSRELEGAEATIAKRDSVQKDIAANTKLLAEIEKGKKEIEASYKKAEENLAQSEAAKKAAAEALKATEARLAQAEERFKSAKDLEEKAAAQLKKNTDKSVQLGKKSSELEAKTALLDESISRYNDAVAKLSQVKVA